MRFIPGSVELTNRMTLTGVRSDLRDAVSVRGVLKGTLYANKEMKLETEVDLTAEELLEIGAVLERAARRLKIQLAAELVKENKIE